MARIQVPETEVQAKLESGEFKFPSSARVNVFNPQGELVSLPGDEINEALKAGYKLENHYQRTVRNTADELSGGIKGSVKVGLSQFADEFALGLPELAYDIAGDPFLIDVKDKIKERHNTANLVGGVLGFAASALYGGPVAKLATGSVLAGEGAKKATAQMLTRAGVTKGAEAGAAKFVSNAAKFAAEGVVSAAPAAGTMILADAVANFDEDRTLNLGAAGETLLLGGGLGILVGSMTGGLAKFAGSARKKFDPSKIDLDSPSPSMYVDEATGVRTAPTGNVDPTSVAQVMKATGASDEAVQQTILNANKKLKPGSDEIVAASERLGLKVLPEQLTDDKEFVSKAMQILKSETDVGFKRNQVLQDQFTKVEKVLETALDIPNIQKSPDFAAEKIKEGIANYAAKTRDRLSDAFKRIRPDYESVRVDQDLIDDLVTSAKNQISKRTFDKDVKDSLELVVKALENTQDQGFQLSDLQDYKKTLQAMYGTNVGKNRVATEYSRKLLEIEDVMKERIARRFAQESGDPEIAKTAASVIEDMKAARKEWSGFMSKMETLSEDLRLGKFSDVNTFLEDLANTNNLDVLKVLTRPGKVIERNFFKELFPNEAQLANEIEKYNVLSKYVVDGKVNIRAFINEFKNIKRRGETETNLIFGNAAPILDDVVKVVESMPPNYTQDFFTRTANRNMSELFSIKARLAGIQGEFADKINASRLNNEFEQMLRAEATGPRRKIVEGVLFAQDEVGKLGSLLAKVTKAGDLLAQKGVQKQPEITVGLTRLFRDDEGVKRDYQQAKERLAQVIANPESVIAQNGADLEMLRQMGIPKTVDVMVGQLTQIATHLMDVIPKATQSGGPFAPLIDDVSDAEKKTFERRLEALENPLGLPLKAVKGELTREEIETASLAYPTLMEQMRQRMIQSFVEEKPTLSYSQRLNLSLLFGTSVDPTLDPVFVLQMQQQNAGQNQGLGQPQQVLNNRVPSSDNVRRSRIPNTAVSEIQRIETRNQ